MLKVLIIDLFIRDPYNFCLGKGNIYNYPEKITTWYDCLDQHRSYNWFLTLSDVFRLVYS